MLFVPTDEKSKPLTKCSSHVSSFRKAFLSKCHLYLEGTDEEFILFYFFKYLLGDICHLRKGLKTQNTSFL